MAMEINERYDHYKTAYTGLLKAEQEKAKETEKGNDEKGSDRTPVLRDAYISREKAGDKPSGLYRVGQDQNGNRRIFYEDPKKSGNAEEGKPPKVKADDPKKPAKKCTGNTDKVDREIEKLKEKKKKLEQQIKEASGDERKVKDLENKLAQVESELSQKDNDTYRRQHTVFS